MLRTSLAGHPNIICHGEMFNPNKKDTPYSSNIEAQSIVNDWIYPQTISPLESDVHAVGFVHHAYHPGVQRAWPENRANPAWNSIWSFLKEIEDLKVIYLYRENLLSRHLSQLMALETGHWQAYSTQKMAENEGKPYMAKPTKQRPSVEINPELLNDDFEETLQYRQKMTGYFLDKPSIGISYEQLCNNLPLISARVSTFLGVSVMNLQPTLEKLENRTLAEAISNYAELKQYFSNSIHAKYFTD